MDVYDVGDGSVVIRHLMALRHNSEHSPSQQHHVCQGISGGSGDQIFVKFYFNVIVCMQTGSL